MVLNISERAIRAAERSAIEKSRRHSLLRDIWRRYVEGGLDENEFRLTAAEIDALYSLARNPMERLLINKILPLIRA